MATIERLRVPEQLPQPISHYTDAVIADGWIYVSGLLALDRDGTLVGDNIEVQSERVMENLQAVLKKAGAGFEDVVKINVYLANIADRAAVNVARRKYFGESRPASTLVEVSAFVIPGALVEVDAVAFRSRD